MTADPAICRACFGRGKRLHGWAVCPGICRDCDGVGTVASVPSADPAIWTGSDTDRRYLVRAYPDGSLTLTTSPRTVESWTSEAELTPVTVAGMAS